MVKFDVQLAGYRLDSPGKKKVGHRRIEQSADDPTVHDPGIALQMQVRPEVCAYFARKFVDNEFQSHRHRVFVAAKQAKLVLIELHLRVIGRFKHFRYFAELPV